MKREDPGTLTHAQPEQTAVFLAQLTNEFASSLNIEETLKYAVDRFVEYLDAEAASIFLLEENNRTLICRECAGPVDIRGLRLDADQGIVGQTVQQNDAKIVRDVSLNPRFAAAVDENTGFATRSILCVPLSVRGKCLGALELLNKRSGDGLFDSNDVQLATTVASAAALSIHNARMALELVEQERVRKELELARQIQESLLPTNMNDDLPVHGVNIPAREVSGDFYDFVRLADGRIYFTLADVSGKGMNAALLMVKATSLLRCLAKKAENPGALLREVNNELCETSTMGMFVTLVAGFLDPVSRTVELANGGHQPALIHRQGKHFEELPAEAPPLGVIPDIDFPVRSVSLGDDAIYLFTDGLSESIDTAGQQLESAGVKRLIESVSVVPSASRLTDIFEIWERAGYETHDDITLMLVDMTR